MSPEISERSFEEAIECGLLQGGPDACAGDTTTVRESPLAYGDHVPGGYRKRSPVEYVRALCLIPRDVVDFILATQPKEWELRQHHAAELKERFLARLSHEINQRGALDVLQNGVKDSGCKFRLAYFRPSSGLNDELRRLHAANLFAVVGQLRYSEKSESRLDLVLLLNGIPIFTAELKNPLNAQTVEDAIRQYRPTATRGRRYSPRGAASRTSRWNPTSSTSRRGFARERTRFTACGRRSRRVLSSTCSRATRPTRRTGGSSRRSRPTRATTVRRLRISSGRSSTSTPMRQVARNGLGDRAGTCIDPRTEIVDEKTICLVSCRRSPEPVFHKWKETETEPGGDFYVRSGPGTVKLSPDDTKQYIRTRFPTPGTA